MKGQIASVVRLFTDRRVWVRQTLVTAAAAAVAWQVGDVAFTDGGLVAAIVATLSVRISLHKSAREGFGQILGTAIGAGVALLSILLLPFGIITVAATVGLCSVVARALRLGEVASINVSVTALIVIGPGISQNAALHRMISTVIGAGVAFTFSYFSHSSTPAGRTIDEIASLGVRAAALLTEMSEGVAVGFTQIDAGGWLGKARRLVDGIPSVRAQALEARSYSKWFPLAERQEAEELLARGVALEHTIVQIRTIARTLFDTAVEGGIPTSTNRHISEALSAASYAVTAKVDELMDQGEGLVDTSTTDDVRKAGTALAETLMDVAVKSDQEQLVRSISLVTNIDRIADSLDQSSPALREIVPSPRRFDFSSSRRKPKVVSAIKLRRKKFPRKSS
ncbi:MAG TPA: FUSC family protein [Candidatus Nanopelagicaceae bacterium]|nr:FUSC family protein [Candidatus Nanopelagicaceae bacterium]